MAPRRQAKQAAAESVAAVADGNVTPPKKRKTAAKPAAADEPKQTKSRSRQAKADKQESEVTGGPASPPKKSRGRQKNAASTATAVVKTDTRSKSKKQVSKEPEDAAVDNHAGEDVAEKRTRGGKTAATAKKAGTTTAAKPKAKAPAARKQKTRATDEEGAGDSGKNVAGASPAKRTTRRMKAIEEADALAKLPAKASNRKRKNVEDTDEAIPEAQTTKEEEEEDEAKVTSKKPRGRAKKMEIDDAPVTTSRGRAKKNAKEVAKPSSEETEIKKQNGKEQNAAIQEDNSKAKNVKITKKGNAKKAALKGKLNAAAGKADETQEEEAATPEVDVKENGETHVVELKQKKRNAGKANAAMNGKVEAKGKQKKGQAVASVDEEEATKDVTTKDEAAENEIIEMNVAPEIDESDIKEVSLIKSNDDTILLDEKEKAEINESKADSTKNDSETSIKETERSGTFLCF